MYSSIIQIGDYLISSDIITEFFSCDYEKCKGACCIIGDSGAPLEESECDSLEREYPNYCDLMSAEGRVAISNEGFFAIDVDGDIVTPLLRDSQECVYTRFEEKNCFCAIERSYFAGKSLFAKPISCRLYPIRVLKLSNGLTALNLHRWDICSDAFIKGEKEKIHVYEFLREPIIFNFGEEFYLLLKDAARILRAAS
ncbi:MAG: DUF3109 family protein [Bacteroidales bacterium]